MKWIQNLIILVCGLIVVALVPVRTDHGCFCEYTGSVKEWTTWLGLLKTNERYRKSKLEVFLEEKHVLELQHKWVSFKGTTTFLLAGKMFAHGTPGPLFYIPRGCFDEWCDSLSNEEKMKLYDLLRSGDEKAIEEKTHEIAEFRLTQLGYPLK